jgi:hypothetical protein
MAISLYDVSVASYLQLLGGVTGFLEKGKSHCEEKGIDLSEIVETRLYPDMLPFRFQIISVSHHSLGAIRGLEAGEFSPPGAEQDLDYAGLQNLVVEARTALEGFKPADVNAMEGKRVLFRLGGREIPFTAENFIMSFSLPNFYFHATTAYDILRMKGVPIGKRDFTGRLRIAS